MTGVDVFRVQGETVSRELSGVSALMKKILGHRRVPLRLFLLGGLVLSLGACATLNDPDDPAAIARYEVNDPFEEWNRSLFALNMLADEVVVKPVALGYRSVFPKPVRRSVTNFMDNITSPVTFTNDLLQFEFGRASITLYRFVINSTIGIGGLFDAAGSAGAQGHKEDFGQTLAVYGFGEGFYFMAPLLGPAPPRDLLGEFVDAALDPLNYTNEEDAWLLRLGLTTFDQINDRAENIESIENLERTSLDYYATVRSIYRQNRNSEIANGRVFNDAPEFDFELDDDFELDGEDNFGADEDAFSLGEDEDMFGPGEEDDMFELGEDEYMFEPNEQNAP